MKYHHHSKVKFETFSGRPALSTKLNGRVIVDHRLLSLWKIAEGRTLEQIIHEFQITGSSPLTTAAGVGCLAEAGLLERDFPSDLDITSVRKVIVVGENDPLITAVIVSYNGIEWLGPCLNSLLTQSYPKIEIIVVDNGSQDGTVNWVRERYPAVQIIEILVTVPLAQAINRGCSFARGDYYFVLNQDIWLDEYCVAELVSAFRSSLMAACAPNLHFMWAPSFINGIGNHYRFSSWGTDNAIGHLDLGQFSSWDEVPSVCFAAALVSRQAWEEIGPVDEGFIMYYEDSEWSYRARLCGYFLGAAPNARVYHAYGGRQAVSPTPFSTGKLSNAVYGRLRFTAKLLPSPRKMLVLVSIALQDIISCAAFLVTFKIERVCSIFAGWKKFLKNPPSRFFRDSQLRGEIFSRKNNIPQPHIWKELPELTWEVVCCEYLPLILAGQTRTIPEIAAVLSQSKPRTVIGYFSRLWFAWQGGGRKEFLRKIWRDFRWYFG